MLLPAVEPCCSVQVNNLLAMSCKPATPGCRLFTCSRTGSLHPSTCLLCGTDQHQGIISRTFEIQQVESWPLDLFFLKTFSPQPRGSLRLERNKSSPYDDLSHQFTFCQQVLTDDSLLNFCKHKTNYRFFCMLGNVSALLIFREKCFQGLETLKHDRVPESLQGPNCV